MNILLLDIETFPQLGYSWTSYETNILYVKEPWSICGFSAKWLGGEHITKVLPDYGKPKSDKPIVQELWKLLDQADVVVAHNGDRFDIRKLNSRFLVHGFNPPSPYKTIDTLKVVKRVFGFTSNKLNDLCQQLGLGAKVPTEGFQLWLDCIAGDAKAWGHMRKYNHNDVVLLEKLYYKLLPYIDNHPNVSWDVEGCPKCGSQQLQSRGVVHTATRTYNRFQCQQCAGWGQGTKSIGSVQVKNAR